MAKNSDNKADKENKHRLMDLPMSILLLVF